MSPNAPNVFISYRRVGTAGYAGRLYDALAARFGADKVFMDVEMEPGVDFVDTIVRVVSACDVLLVVIGPEWLAPAAGGTQPRLADPADFVRLEVATALRRPDVRVIPLLVGGAEMPRPDALPEELKDLCNRNAVLLSDVRWRKEVVQLMGALDGTAEPQEEPARHPLLAGRRARWAAAAAGVVLVAAVLLATRGSGDSDSPPASTTPVTPVALTVAAPGETPQATNVSLSREGQTWVGTFDGRKGERVALDMRDVTPDLSGTVTILDRADDAVLEYETQNALLLADHCSSPLSCGPARLKRTGPHRVVIRDDSGAGSLRIRLYEVPPDDEHDVKLGESVDLDLAIGQAGNVTFRSPRPGTRVVVRVTEISLAGYARVVGPDGRAVLDKPVALDDSTGFMERPLTLERSGPYTFNFRGNQIETGALTVEVRAP